MGGVFQRQNIKPYTKRFAEMQGAFLLEESMLDVVVRVYKDGVLVNGYNAESNDAGGTAAALGRAVLGEMRLGEV